MEAFGETLKQCTQANEGVPANTCAGFIDLWLCRGQPRGARWQEEARHRPVESAPRAGFTAIQGVGGHIFFATGGTEVLHRTYVYAPARQAWAKRQAKDKYDLRCGCSDFPNSTMADCFGAASLDASRRGHVSQLQLEDARSVRLFRTLVDAIVGDKGAFKKFGKA